MVKFNDKRNGTLHDSYQVEVDKQSRTCLPLREEHQMLKRAAQQGIGEAEDVEMPHFEDMTGMWASTFLLVNLEFGIKPSFCRE